MSTLNLNIVVAQVNLLVGDIMGNAKRIITETQRATQQFKADLVVFPELALCSYPPEDLVFRSDFLQTCQLALQKIAQATRETAIIIGYPQKIHGDKTDCIYNQAAVIQNGEILAVYLKQELPNYMVFDEKRYFHPGGSPCVFTFKGIKIGLLICEDLWFPGPIQQARHAGAEMIISINASPFDRNKARARETMLVERVHETHIPIVYANLIGGQDELVFDGGSMVVNQHGQRCQQAGYFIEELMPINIEINNGNIEIISQKLPPYLSEEENVYRALVLGVRDYVRKNNFPGVVLGISGGIDSALTLAISSDAIGAENIEAVSMPSRYTSLMSKEDAIHQTDFLGVHLTTIDIEPIFQTFLESVKQTLPYFPADSTEENLQARIRGTLLMAISNKKGSLVLTTGNKSEMSVGYATLYGDMAGGFGVLKDVPKTMVYRLAQYRNQISPVIPIRVIERPPTAELAAGQLDQDTLPPYPILDEILLRYIEQDQSPETIYTAGIEKKVVDAVIKMINRNEYKRRQAPIGIRTTQRAFGKDRRYPITSGWK